MMRKCTLLLFKIIYDTNLHILSTSCYIVLTPIKNYLIIYYSWSFMFILNANEFLLQYFDGTPRDHNKASFHFVSICLHYMFVRTRNLLLGINNFLTSPPISISTTLSSRVYLIYSTLNTLNSLKSVI